MKVETLAKAMGNAVSTARYRALLPALDDALLQANCTTLKRAAMFLAQIGTESGGLRWMEELASGAEYEGRRDLGNTHAGDGKRFKGRGPIQITGRTNYTSLSKWAYAKGYVPTKTYFVDHPAQLSGDRYGFLGAVWYWTVARNMNSYADKGDVLGATRAVNGGTNGYPDRLARWNRCLALGSAIVPVAAAVKQIVSSAKTVVKGLGAAVDLSEIKSSSPVAWRTLRTPGKYPGAACSCMTKSIPLVEAILIKQGVIKECLDFWQGGYDAGGVAASGNTHAGGGVVDTKQKSKKVIAAFRACGWAAWYRGPAKKYGKFPTKHIHAVMIGCPHLSAGAATQVTMYRQGRNGLANGGADYHDRPTKILTWQQAYDQLTTEERKTVVKPKKFLRTKAKKFAKYKYYHWLPITNTGRAYSMLSGPGTVEVNANIVADRDCWARFVTVNRKANGKEKISTRYPRVKIRAGGDQLALWDTIGGPRKGYKHKYVRLQLLAYSYPVTVSLVQVRAGKE